MTEPIDEEYLTSFAREQQAQAYERNQHGGDRCRRCGHGFHGLGCRADHQGPCLCPSSFEDVAS